MTAALDARGIFLPGRLERTDLQLEPRTLTALIGPNGGGKTSLLRAMARIDHAGGAVNVAGEDLDRAAAARRRKLLCFLPASREIVWPISAEDLILLGLDAPDPARVQELIGLLELEQLARRAADRLSTGERARVLLARALAARPQVLLLDEPLSNLDPYWALRTLDILRQCADEGAAVLVAVHDLSVLAGFDRALLVAEGSVQADGAPAQVLDSPAFEKVFRVRRAGAGWSISPGADRRSSQ